MAQKWSKSKAWVSERLQLLELKPAAHALVEDNVTSDIAVINSVNRAERIDSERGTEVAERVRHSEKKREVARAGLQEVKAKTPRERRGPRNWTREAGSLAMPSPTPPRRVGACADVAPPMPKNPGVGAG